MRNIYIDQKKYTLPESIQECNQAELVAVMDYQISLQMFANRRDRLAAKIRLFTELSKVSTDVIKKLTGIQLERLTRLSIYWAESAKIEAKPFPSFFVQQPAVGRKHITKLFLPAEDLSDMSCIELAMANIKSILLSKGMEDALYELIATICRPRRSDLVEFMKSEKWTGDEREPYNSQKADEWAEIIKYSISPGTAKAILEYFWFINKNFWQRYEDLLDESEEHEPMYENGEGQVTMLMEIGRQGGFGDFEKVAATNVHTIWMNLRDMKLKAAVAEKNIDTE